MHKNAKTMTNKDFRKTAHQLVDWMADYFENIGDYPVKSDVRPGDAKNQLPGSPPGESESFEQIFSDFQQIIMPGVTHWQHPGYFAYFPASRSHPSVLAEMLTATLGLQCMIWYSSPSAEELEERMMEWLRQMLDLPEGFTGVIQDTASTATLVAILQAREQKTALGVNKKGLYEEKKRFRVYASEHIHSSIAKAVRIAGLGEENLVLIESDESFALLPDKLERAINEDLDAGHLPLCVVAAIGTTSSTAIDPLRPIGEICKQYDCFLHVDAAYAGTALILPEMRWMAEGMELADSFVFNPHKWMFTNFDCTAHFVKDKDALVSTFNIIPEYLKTPEDKQVNNYRDWGIQLGRRFRALKLWFVIRSFGVEGLQKKIREHLQIGKWLENEINKEADFELLAPVPLNLVCFRYHPLYIQDEGTLNELNKTLLEQINNGGQFLLTHTKLSGKYTIRLVAGNTEASLENVQKAWEMIKKLARHL